MQTDLFEQIKNALDGMSKSHKRIAAYILEHSEKAANLTATKLGTEVGISRRPLRDRAWLFRLSGISE